MKQKWFAILCVMLCILSMSIGVSVFGAENSRSELVEKGECTGPRQSVTKNDSVHWSFERIDEDGDGVKEVGRLTIYGLGYMENYGCNYGEGITVQPWIAYKNEITEVKVSQGVESIGIRAFEGHKNLKKVELPEGLECIFAYAFKDCINLKTIRIPSSICILDSDAFENCPIVF